MAMENTDYLTKINPNGERRYFAGPVTVETRDGLQEKESRSIFGYGIVFNSPSREMRLMNGRTFIEKVDPHAADGLLDDPDTMSYFNHDVNLVYARNGKNLKLGVDEVGVWYRFEALETTVGNDLLINTRAGVVNTSSFGFDILEKNTEWQKPDKGPWMRTLKKFSKIYDIGPVTLEAYPDTTVANRSLENVVAEMDRLEKESKKDERQWASDLLRNKHELFKLSF